MGDSGDLVRVKLPDGTVKEFASGVTPREVAESISPRLAAAAVVARVQPAAAHGALAAASGEAAMYAVENPHAERLVDLGAPLTEDVSLQLLTEKDPDALPVVRHSAAHVLATAVLELFPETKLGHGPPTESGFFYDFLRPTPFTPEDLEKIEKRMGDVVARDEKFDREFIPREE